jgi:hypothetical protein
MALAIETKVPLYFKQLLHGPTIPEDDLPKTANSQKMTYRYRGLANSGLQQAGIGKAPVNHFP